MLGKKKRLNLLVLKIEKPTDGRLIITIFWKWVFDFRNVKKYGMWVSELRGDESCWLIKRIKKDD